MTPMQCMENLMGFRECWHLHMTPNIGINSSLVACSFMNPVQCVENHTGFRVASTAERNSPSPATELSPTTARPGHRPPRLRAWCRSFWRFITDGRTIAGLWAILQHADWIAEDVFNSHIATISVRITARTFALLLFLGALYRQGCQFLSLDIVHSVGINRILVVSWVILHGRYI